MMSDDNAINDFSGTVRLFPLPNLVLFPNVVQPLHIFEPRYREMTADALAGDRLIAVVLLQDGADEASNHAAIHSVACLGRIIADQMLADGRYNLLLRGARRVRVHHEVKSSKLYRNARAELLDEAEPPKATARALRERLESFILPRFRAKGAAVEQLHELFKGVLTIGALCDVLSFALPFPAEGKQSLLEEVDVVRRVDCMIELIESHIAAVAGDRKYPPDFSPN